MKRILTIITILFLIVEAGHGLAKKNDEFDKLISRVSTRYEQEYLGDRLANNVVKHLVTLSSKGDFSDVDYTDVAITKWKPIAHLNKVRDMIFAYTKSDSNLFEDKDIYSNIVSALEFWYTTNPKSKNWWFNQIAVPKVLGLSLIQMRKGKEKLPADLEQRLVERMAENAGDMDRHVGANLTDIATDYFYRACLMKDKKALDRAIDSAFEPLKLVAGAGEGIKYDYSFHQHGSQLYIGGYSEELIKGVIDFALNMIGTSYALKGEKLAILSKYVRETYLTTLRGQFIHYNAIGRSVSRIGQTNKSSFSKFITSMKSLDPTNADEYESAIRRMKKDKPSSYKITSSNKLYPISDYVIHTRPFYSFSVRAVSERTAYIEHGNGENLDAYFMTFGSTCTMVEGNEYDDIFPVWDWKRIPGVTNPYVEDIPQRKKWGVSGTDIFVGGVSDNQYAIMTYSHSDTIQGKSTQAKKSWFFFDKEIVCLGAGISSDSPFPINTTIEQSLLFEDIRVSTNGKEKILEKGKTFSDSNVDWVYHNKVGYVFPNKGNISISGKQKSGTWKYINDSQNDKEVRKDVFCMYFDHGVRPIKTTYSYVVIPGLASSSEMDKYKVDEISIIANSESLQAVINKKLGVLQIVFNEAGRFQSERAIVEVDKPCVVMLKNLNQSNVELYVADPAQKKSDIKLNVSIPRMKKKDKELLFKFSEVKDEDAGFSKKTPL